MTLLSYRLSSHVRLFAAVALPIEIAEGLQPLRDRLAELEAENAGLRARLAAAAP